MMLVATVVSMLLLLLTAATALTLSKRTRAQAAHSSSRVLFLHPSPSFAPPLSQEKPLRILLLIEPTPFNYISGYVNRFKEMINYCKLGGDTIEIVVPDNAKDAPTVYDGFNITSVPGFNLFFYKSVTCSFDLWKRKVGELCKTFKPDIIHATTPSAICYAAAFWSKIYKIPLVMSYHTDFAAYAKSYLPVPGSVPLAHFLVHRLHSFADMTLVTSPQLGEHLESIGVTNVHVWEKGINADKFNPKFKDAAMRTRLSQGHPEAPLLIYVGRLGSEKKLQRIKGVLDANPEARLALVGGGPAMDDYRRVFEGYKVNFVGPLSGDELSQSFASADIFLMPSDTETLGFVAIEAMASGIPVVGVAAGGLVDIIQSDINGFLVDNDDGMIEFTERSTQLIRDVELRTRLGANARKWAEGLSWEAATSKLRNIQYRSVIAATQEKWAAERAAGPLGLWRLLSSPVNAHTQEKLDVLAGAYMPHLSCACAGNRLV